jgi:hypothetical protein
MPYPSHPHCLRAAQRTEKLRGRVISLHNEHSVYQPQIEFTHYRMIKIFHLFIQGTCTPTEHSMQFRKCSPFARL